MKTFRVTSSLWVSAYVRRCAGEGGFAAVLVKGDPSAGAIFIEVSHDDGADLYGPMFSETGRAFGRIVVGDTEGVAERIAKERAFDRDLWLVGVDDRKGRTFLRDDELG